MEILLLFSVAYALIGRPASAAVVLTGGHLVAVTADVVGARSGLAQRVPDRLWRGSRVAAALAILSVPVAAVALGVSCRRSPPDRCRSRPR